MERIAEGVFTPVWGTVFSAESVAAAIGQPGTAGWLATTILDGDDAMARDCLAAVSASWDGHDSLLVDCPEGYTIDRTGGVFQTRDGRSRVRSLVEPIGPGSPPATVLAPQEGVRRVDHLAPMWIDVDHEPTEVDPPRGRRIDPARVAERFAVDLAFDPAPA